MLSLLLWPVLINFYCLRSPHPPYAHLAVLNLDFMWNYLPSTSFFSFVNVLPNFLLARTWKTKRASLFPRFRIQKARLFATAKLFHSFIDRNREKLWFFTITLVRIKSRSHSIHSTCYCSICRFENLKTTVLRFRPLIFSPKFYVVVDLRVGRGYGN